MSGSEADKAVNAANKEFSDWCETLPVNLIIQGCEIHGRVQAAMFAMANERDAALKELAATTASLNKLRDLSSKLVDEVRRAPGIPIYASRDATDEVLGKKE